MAYAIQDDAFQSSANYLQFYYFRVMVLNVIWLVFFFGAFIACIVQWLAFGDTGIFNKAILGAFDMSRAF